jgi:hypothetical protein
MIWLDVFVFYFSHFNVTEYNSLSARQQSSAWSRSQSDSSFGISMFLNLFRTCDSRKLVVFILAKLSAMLFPMSSNVAHVLVDDAAQVGGGQMQPFHKDRCTDIAFHVSVFKTTHRPYCPLRLQCTGSWVFLELSKMATLSQSFPTLPVCNLLMARFLVSFGVVFNHLDEFNEAKNLSPAATTKQLLVEMKWNKFNEANFSHWYNKYPLSFTLKCKKAQN